MSPIVVDHSNSRQYILPLLPVLEIYFGRVSYWVLSWGGGGGDEPGFT